MSSSRGASVAVIGAGMAGIAAARALSEAGLEVTVFEKSHRPGGRAATRATELGGFDHGAQYFTVGDAEFAAAIAPLYATHTIAPWTPRMAAGQGAADKEWLVGVPNMRALPDALAEGLNVRYDTQVLRIESIGSERRRWCLRVTQSATEQPAIEVTEGLYDAVLVAVPAPQALDLLQGSTLGTRLRTVRMRTTWALMLGFAAPLATDFDVCFVRSPRLAWIARDSSKPSRRLGERWVAHASHDWSEEHLLDDPNDVRVKLEKAFHEVTGTALQPLLAHVHRWRYAAPAAPLAEGFLWHAGEGLGACGDWCLGGRLEAAWLSGRRLAGAALEGLAT